MPVLPSSVMFTAHAMPGTGRTVGEALLEPHRSYAKVVQLLMRLVKVNGMAHITGGGITDNLPRSIPRGLGAEIDLGAWETPPLFTFLKRTGNIADLEMLRTFNMGMGYLLIVARRDAEKAFDGFSQAGEEPVLIGRVVAGENEVKYLGELRYGESN